MSRFMRSAGAAFVPILITSATAATAPATGDACSLLSKEDAAAALGEAAAGPTQTRVPDDGSGATESACEYTGSGNHSIKLNLTRLPATALFLYSSMCKRKSKDGLAGLGDVACWHDDKHGELNVLKETAFLSIQLRRSGNPTEPIKAAAKKALAKLK